MTNANTDDVGIVKVTVLCNLLIFIDTTLLATSFRIVSVWKFQRSDAVLRLEQRSDRRP